MFNSDFRIFGLDGTAMKTKTVFLWSKRVLGIQRTIAARIIDGKLGECTVSSSGQDAQPAVRSHQLASSWHLHLKAFSTWRKTCRQPAKHPSLQFLLGFTLTCSIAKNHSSSKLFVWLIPTFWWGGSHLQLSKNKDPIFLCVPAYATQVWCCQAAVCLDNAQRLWGEKGGSEGLSAEYGYERSVPPLQALRNLKELLAHLNLLVQASMKHRATIYIIIYIHIIYIFLNPDQVDLYEN